MSETQETLRLSEAIDDNSGHCTLTLVGWVDSSNSFLLEQWLDANLDKGYKRVILSCENLQFASSAGIRVFLGAARRVHALADCDLVFSQVNENIRRTFVMTGLDRIITQVG